MNPTTQQTPTATYISFDSALEQIANATALYVDDEHVVFPSMFDNDEDAPKPGVVLSFEHHYGEEMFRESDNPSVKVYDGAMLLTNTNGELAKLRLLVCKPVNG